MGVDELWGLLRDARSMPYGAAQIALVEQVIRHADATGDRHLAFAVRMFGTESYLYGGEPAKSFVTFSWCVSDFDSAPAPHHQRYSDELLWQFKWMANGLTDFPEVPLARTYAVLDDMQRRYRDAGHSLQAVHKHRFLVARHIGADDEADEWYERWITSPRDGLSDCAGCDPSAQASFLADRGRDDEAIALAEPVLAGQLSCTEQPQGILTALLLPYLRTGRLEDAADAHRRAYRLVRGSLAELADIAEHLRFCVRTGNEVRGLELLQRHIDWLDRAPSPAAAMRFAAAGALVLRRLAQARPGLVTVHRGAHGQRPAGEVPAAALAEELADFATALAARFDARNGTAAQGGYVAAVLATPRLVDVALSPTARRRPVPPGAFAHRAATGAAAVDRSAPHPGDADETGTGLAGRGVDGTDAGGPAGAGADPGGSPVDVAGGPGSSGVGHAGPVPTGPQSRGAPEPVVIAADADAAELLALADRYGRADRDDAVAAVLAAFDERFAGADLPPQVAAQRADLRAGQAYDDRDADAAEAAWRLAAELFTGAGDELSAARCRGRLGVLLCLTGRGDEGLPLVRAEVAAHSTTPAGRPVGPAGAADNAGVTDQAGAGVDQAGAGVADRADACRRLAAAQARLATALLVLDRPAEALAAQDRADALGSAADEPYQAAGFQLQRAQILAALHRHDEARTAARAGVEAYRVLGGDRYPAACLLYGRLLDDPAESLAAFDEALSVAGAGVDLDARAGRARALLALGEAGAAVDDLVEVVGACTERGNELGAAFARHELADAYRRAGRPVEAAEVAEEAVTELDRLGQPAAADRCRYLLAGLYRELGDDEAALQGYDRLAQGFADEPGARAQVLEEAGDLLYQLDRDALAALRFQAAADGYRTAGAWPDELRVLRRRAVALHFAGEHEQARAALRVAGERHGELPAELAARPEAVWERAVLDIEATRILMAAGRYEDGLATVGTAAERLRGIGAHEVASQADLLTAEALLRLDRPAGAEPVLRAALASLPDDRRAGSMAAGLLAETLEMLGRDAQASAVRAEYGLPGTPGR